MIIVLILAAAAFYFFYVKNQDRAAAKPNGKDAEAILRERFAHGEIDEATYLAMKRVLND
jgi:uncharacterized membrane protein